MKQFLSLIGVLFVILISSVACTSCSKSEEIPYPVIYNGEAIEYEIYYEYAYEWRDNGAGFNEDYSYLDIIIAFPSKGEELVINLALDSQNIDDLLSRDHFNTIIDATQDVTLDTGDDCYISYYPSEIKISGSLNGIISITGGVSFLEGIYIAINYNGPIERRENTDS